jgi:uncharacterized protein YaiL (DUF2058 family)
MMTIDQMIADGLSMETINKRIVELTKERDARIAAEEAVRQAAERKERAEKERQEVRKEFIDTCVKYLIAIEAIDKLDVDKDFYNMLERALKDFEADARAMKRMFGLL